MVRCVSCVPLNSPNHLEKSECVVEAEVQRLSSANSHVLAFLTAVQLQLALFQTEIPFIS